MQSPGSGTHLPQHHDHTALGHDHGPAAGTNHHYRYHHSLMTTVVTGASGFLGGALVRSLLEQDRAVRAVDLHRGPTLDGLDVEFVRGDVLEPESLLAALEGANTVYHLVGLISIAGDPTGQVSRINVDGVRNVAQASLQSRVKRMVHCSSVHAFDLETHGRVVTEESARASAPQLPAYDRSKAAGGGKKAFEIGAYA